MADASRGEDISALLDRAENDLIQKYGSWLSIPPVPQLFQRYKEKYYPILVYCQTEGEVETVARRIASDLKKDVSILPEFMKSFVNKEIDKVTNVVRTKGSMQLNFPRARQVMKDRGDIFSDQELSDYMYTIRGGVRHRGRSPQAHVRSIRRKIWICGRSVLVVFRRHGLQLWPFFQQKHD